MWELTSLSQISLEDIRAVQISRKTVRSSFASHLLCIHVARKRGISAYALSARISTFGAASRRRAKESTNESDLPRILAEPTLSILGHA